MLRVRLAALAALSATLCAANASAQAITIAVTDGFGFEAGDASGDTDPVAFTLTRSGAGALNVNVVYEGTATEGTDYTGAVHTVSFGASETSRTITLVPQPDWTAEPGDAETVVVRVVAGSGYDLPSPASIALGIADVDSGGNGLVEREIDVESHVLSIPTPHATAYDSATSVFALNPNGTTEFTLYVPRRKGRAPDVIRGVVVGLPGSGGRDYYDGYDVFLAEHGFAYLSLTERVVQDDAARTREEGIEFFDDDPHDRTIDPAVADPVLDALDAFAASLARPELRHAPLLLYGHSRGALTAHLLAARAPARVLGFVANHWAAPIAAPTPALCRVPALFLAAEYDRNFSADAARYWEAGRARGALWGWALGWGINHNHQLAQQIEAIEFFEAILPLRYDFRAGVAGHDPSVGAVTLTTLEETSGYLGERIFETFRNPWAAAATEQTEAPNWYRDFETQNPIVAPYATFDREDRRAHPWFPNARVATLFQTHVSLGSLSLRFRSPDFASRRGLFVAGAPIRASLDVGGFPEATHVEFLANEHVVGTVTALVGAGASRHADFEFRLDTEGVYRLSAHAIADDGATRVSGDHGVEGALVATIRPALARGNHAPTVSVLENQTPAAGASLALPFVIGDVDTHAENLAVSTVSHLGALATDVRIEGSGANRTLAIDVAADVEGDGDVLVFVSDGDLVATEYVRVTVGAPQLAPAMTPYVRPEWEIIPSSVWTRPMTMHVVDSDTPPESVVVTTDATSASIPQANRRVSGFYAVRAIATSKLEGDRVSQGFRLSDGAHETTASYDHDDGVAIDPTPPSISRVPDVYLPPGTTHASASFRVADLETPEGTLGVTAASSDATRLPTSAIELTHLGVPGLDRDRRVTVTPTTLEHADIEVTLTVRDARGSTSATTFVVHVGQVDPGVPTVPRSHARGRGCSVGDAREVASTGALACAIVAVLLLVARRLR